MIELACNPSVATHERLAVVVEWARRLYGTDTNHQVEVVAQLPEPVSYMSAKLIGSGRSSVVHSRTPAVQLDGQRLRIHPALCKAGVPRYVLRYVVVMGLIYSSTRSPRLLEAKRRLAPYRATATEWLSRKGYEEESWDV